MKYFTPALTLLLVATFIGAQFWKGCAQNQENLSSSNEDENKVEYDSNTLTPQSPIENKSNNQTDPNDPNMSSNGLIKTETDFLANYPGSWRFKRMERGRLSYITGSSSPNLGRNPASVKDFVQRISPLLEVHPQDLTEPKEFSKTDLSRVYQISQKNNGYNVYQSMLSVHIRESDNSIFMVNNQLKDISNYNKDIRYTSKQAETYIQNKYRGEISKLIFKDGPVIFATDEYPGELAWIYHLTFKQPALHTVEIVIGANSGEEIHKQSIVVH